MMNVDFKKSREIEHNPVLHEAVNTDSALKEWLVGYVGEKHKPESEEVTVEMIVATIADEFPEFLMVIAEENWVRGYHQALVDVEEGQNMTEQETVEVETKEEDGS
jgi:hypothetical protein